MSSVLPIWADHDGESHFEDVDVAFVESDFVPPAPPVLLSEPEPATAYILERVPPGWRGDWHPSPREGSSGLVGELGELGDGEHVGLDGSRTLVLGSK